MATTTKELLAVRDDLLGRFRTAAADRRLRPDSTPAGDPGWLEFELGEMWAGVNYWRGRHQLPAVDLDQVRRIEQYSSGHIDYAEKYALRCAELACGSRRGSSRGSPAGDGPGSRGCPDSLKCATLAQ